MENDWTHSLAWEPCMLFTAYSQMGSSRDWALLSTAIAISSHPGSASLDLTWLQVAPIPPASHSRLRCHSLFTESW